jgi:capsular polysaccharide biosynthesis protein
MIDIDAERSRLTEDGGPAPGGREDTLSLAEVLRILRRRFRLILLVVAAFLALGAGYALLQPVEYEASGLVIVGEAPDGGARREAQGIQFDVEGLKALTSTMAQAAVSRPIVDGALARSGQRATAEQVTPRLQAEPLADTLFVRITYTDESPQAAQRFVDAVSTVFAERVDELDPIAIPVGARVWERAVVPTEPAGPNVAVIAILALVTGTVLGVLAAFLLEGLRNAGVVRRRTA